MSMTNGQCGQCNIFYHAVLEAAVTGVEHPRWEERPVALVALRDRHKGETPRADIMFAPYISRFIKQFPVFC